ncbi:endonuclease III [Nanoarchaeota archaeon]
MSGDIIKLLRQEYGEPRTALDYYDPLQLLVSTILSAQCTDKRVNMVTKDLFKKYKTAKDYADAKTEELELDIKSTGFYKQKTKSIQGCCKMLLSDFNGKVPDSMDSLVKLPGVGRKTANVVLNNAFNQLSGITVDTHVKRVGERLGLHSGKDPVKIEFEMMDTIPKKDWIFISHALIEHGRAVCVARKPRCPNCPLAKLCPSYEKYMEEFWQ